MTRQGFTRGIGATLLLAMAGNPLQADPVAADRPGFLFSSFTVGRGVFQVEAGLPAVTQVDDFRLLSTPVLLRWGVGEQVELRLGAVPYNRVDVDLPFGGSAHDSGYGDIEVGAKWHLLDNEGARPSLALIPSVVLPVGEEGFSAEEPAYVLLIATEWMLADGWGLTGLVGTRFGEIPDGERFNESTLAASLGRPLASPAWSAFVEAAVVFNDLGDGSEAAFLGGGVKYLVNDDLQLDLLVDRGLNDDAVDWIYSLGLTARF